MFCLKNQEVASKHSPVLSMLIWQLRSLTGYGRIPDTGSCETLHHSSPWRCRPSRASEHWTLGRPQRKDADPGACPAQRRRAGSAERWRGIVCCDEFAWSDRGSGILPQSPPPQGLQTRSLGRRGGDVKMTSERGAAKLPFAKSSWNIYCTPGRVNENVISKNFINVIKIVLTWAQDTTPMSKLGI